MSKRVDLATSRRKLVMLWGIAFVIFTLFLVAQTAADVFGAQTARAWNWYVPSILPTLTLVLGSTMWQVERPTPRQRVDDFAYRCALWTSVFYLLLLAVALVFQRARASLTPLQWLEQSNLFLAPAQGIAALTVSRFFQTATSGAQGREPAGD